MSVNTNPFTLNEQNGVLTFTKTGISKASVFTGFCAYHDKHIFSPIENTLFYPSAENLFLQAYRISCMEYFKKSLIVKNQYKLRNEFNSQLKELKKERNDDDLKTKEKIIKSILSEKERHEKQGLSDTGKIKKKLDEIYLSKSFSRLRHKVFEVENNKVVTGASILIEIDFYNNKLQNLNDYNQDQFIIFNCISTSKDKGFIFFSWLQENSLAEKLIKSLMEKENKEDLLVEFFYSYSENTYSNPEWWDSLSSDTKNVLSSKLNEVNSSSRDLSRPRKKYDAFKIISHFDL